MTIRELLEAKNIDTKKIDKEINTGKFFDAVQSGDCDKIRYFIHSGIDINTKDKYGCTALINASDSNKKKVVRLLIELGADINIRDDEGQTALMKAAFVNADEVVAILIRSGADINVKDNQGQTPFMMAALSDSEAVAEILAELGADVDAVDNQGKKALDIAGLSFARFIRDGEIREKINFKRIRHVLDSYPNFKNYGIIRGFKDVYKKKYGHDLCTPYLDSYLKDFNSEKNDKILMLIGENEIQVIPSKVVVQQFLSSEFANKGYGYKSDARSMFFEKYHCELEDDILNEFIRKFTEKNTDKFLNKLDDGRIQVSPSNEIVYQFLSFEFANKGYGYKSNVQSMFFEKYHCELEDDILSGFIRKFTEENADKLLKKLDDGRIQVAPSNEIVQQFLSSEFVDKDYGCVNDVRTKFLEKYQCAFSENSLDEFIIFFSGCFSDKVLKKMKDGKIQVVPSKESAIRFLSDEFANKDYGYIIDVRTIFLEKYHCELTNEILLGFIIEFTEKYTNKILKKLEEEKVRIEPSYNEIRKFLLSEFEGQPENEIDKKEVFENFKTKYQCDLNNYDLEICIDSFNSSLANRVIIRKDNSYQIVKIVSSSVEELSSIAIKMRRFFLAEDVGYSYSIEEIKKELGCEHVNDREVELASAIANTKLKDINIIFKSNVGIKSTFKTAGMFCGVINMDVCPVCGESFSEYENMHKKKKNHILGHYSSEEKDCAILTKTGKTVHYARFTYFCSHCNQELDFDDDRISIIYIHLVGACKSLCGRSHPKEVYKPIGGGNMQNTIWKGAAYANGDAFLGNSGQLLREDNGRFGSYPLEDNYGDGD